MKKTLKIILGAVGVLALGLAVLVAWNWQSVEILTGTEDLGGQAQAIPEIAAPEMAILERGESDWPCWRGAAGDARSTVTGIKTDWTDGLTQRWEVNYLCQGEDSAAWTAPVVQGDRVVVCGRDEGHDLVFCLNATNGQLLWHAKYQAEADSGHGMGMRATPAIDADRVYSFGRSGDLVCWDLQNGTTLWHKNVGDEGGAVPKWGHASSPLVIDDAVLVQGGGAARTIAYHKETGEVLWTSGQGDAGYAALVATTLGDTPACLVFHGNGLAAVALDTGRALWDTPWETAYGVNATTPLIDGEHVFITSGYGTGVQKLKASDTGLDILWTNKVMASHHSDGHILDGYLYGYSGQSIQNRGAFKCVDLATGTQEWSTKDMGWGTSLAVDGHILCLDIKGNLFLMKPDPEEFIQVTALPKALGNVKGPVWTLPVIANGRLFLRFKQRLVCYSLL